MKFYFAHALSDFDTAFEAKVLAALAPLRIENPNQPHHQKNYKNHGMTYFTEDVLPDCDGCIYLDLPMGWVGSGVALGVWKFLRRDPRAPVFQFVPTTMQLKPVLALYVQAVLSREETRAWTAYLRTLPNGGRFDDGSSMPMPIDPPVVPTHA
jgi:hypothetical protein